MKEFSYKILDEKKKRVRITYGDKTLKFQLKIKRSFTVLKELLRAYPNFFNVHDLDTKLHDPNKAHSDLKLANGFANFIIEKRGSDRSMQAKIDIENLFKYYGHKDSKQYISLSIPEYRGGLTNEIKDIIFEKFNGKCNITGIKLNRKLQGIHYFGKSLVTARYDHRKPVSKNGTEDLENFQLLSDYLNSEKNKICNICAKNNCEVCALAYPEKYDIIQANEQNIKELKTIRRE
jgi:hypothetical protein